MTEDNKPGEKPAQKPAQKPAAKKPLYGEMAPEGWVSPVTGEPVNTDSAESASRPANSAPSGQSAPSHSGTLDGVPHNLGVNKDAPSKAAKTADTDTAAPATASERFAEPTAPSESPTGKTARAKPVARRDRFATIALLALGAFGALNLGDAFMQLSQSTAQLYALYDLGSFTAPDWLGTASTIGWVSMLSIWAITLIMSIQFMQRGKLSFYIPLIGAAVSFIVLIVIMSIIVVNGMPELMTYVQTNGINLDKFQELQ